MKVRLQFLATALVLFPATQALAGSSLEDRVDFARCKALVTKDVRWVEGIRCFQALPADAKAELAYPYYLALAYEGAGDLTKALNLFQAYAKALEKFGPTDRELVEKMASLKTRIEDAQKAAEKAAAFNQDQPLEAQRQKVEAYGRKYPEDTDVPARLQQIAAELAREKLRKNLSGVWQRGASRFRIKQTGSSIVAVYESLAADDARVGFSVGERKLTATLTDGRVVGMLSVAMPAQGSSTCFDPQLGTATQCRGDCSGLNRRETGVDLVVSENGREMNGWANLQQLDYRSCSWLSGGPTNERTWVRLVNEQ